MSAFRSLIESGKPYPNMQSSLKEMTDSEKVERGLAKWDTDGNCVPVAETANAQVRASISSASETGVGSTAGGGRGSTFSGRTSTAGRHV